jgi:MFS family permease
MGLASIGFLAGAALSNRLPGRIGIGRTIIVSAAFAAPAFLLIALTPENLNLAAVTLFVGWFVAGMTQVIYNVAQISLRQAITPPEMQSRMNATMRFIVWGTIPIGSILGGVLATFVPVRLALIFAALASSLAVAPVLASPLRSLRDIPGEPEPVEGPGNPTRVSGAALTTNEAGLP